MEYTVEVYNPDMYSKILNFLSAINSLKKVEEAIIENAIIVKDQKESICGMISYEVFRKNALIRYFIFDSHLSNETIDEMFSKLYVKAKENDIKQIFSIISNDEVRELFEELGFVEVDKRKFYISEQNINKTKYHEAIVMGYDLQIDLSV